MPTIRFVDYPHISLTTPPLQILRPKIKKAYFAEAKIEEVEVTSTSKKEAKTHTVQAGDNLSKIADQEGVTVADIINSDDKLTESNKGSLKIGQEITLPTEVSTTEKKQKITFTKTNTGIIGSELYVIVETEDFQDYKVSINVKQGKVEGIEAQDAAISLKDEQGKYQNQLITTVGGLCDTDFVNKDDYTDMAIFKLAIDTEDKDKKKAWIAALEKAEDKKTPLYLLVDAHSLEGQEKMNINYFGDTEEGEIRSEKVTNRWLDVEGEWFMVEGQAKKIAPGHYPIKKDQIAYLMVEGCGVAGSYSFNGAARVYAGANGQMMLSVSGAGSTPVMANNDVKFSGKAELLINGKITQSRSLDFPNGEIVYQSGMFPLSTTKAFTLPSYAISIEVKLSIGYVYSGPEGRAVPIPSRLNTTISI